MNDILANKEQAVTTAATTTTENLSLDRQMKDQINEISKQANNLKVESKETFELASSQISTLDTFSKKIKEFYKEPKEKAAAAWKASLDAKQAVSEQEAGWLKPVNEAKDYLKRQQGSYTRYLIDLQQQAERKAAEETRRREEEARFLAEKEAKANGVEEVKPIEVVPEPIFVEPIPKATLVVTYEITNIDVTKLPALFAGEILVSPNLLVIKKLIKEYNSTHSNPLTIPGVEYDVVTKTR